MWGYGMAQLGSSDIQGWDDRGSRLFACQERRKFRATHPGPGRLQNRKRSCPAGPGPGIPPTAHRVSEDPVFLYPVSSAEPGDFFCLKLPRISGV